MALEASSIRLITSMIARIDSTDRRLWGFTPVKYRDDMGERFAFVRSDLRNPDQAVIEAFAVHLGRMVDIVEVLEPKHERRPGVPREADWVAEDLGTSAEQRRRDEMNGIRKSTVHAVTVSPPESFRDQSNERKPRKINVEYRKDDRLQYLPMTLSEFAAGLATEEMWDKVFAGADISVDGPVIDPLGNAEEMGEGAYDEDGM